MARWSQGSAHAAHARPQLEANPGHLCTPGLVLTTVFSVLLVLDFTCFEPSSHHLRLVPYLSLTYTAQIVGNILRIRPEDGQ